ncbi:MAG: hypothetical protein HYY93_07450 [Planctomycetes bacterium]|nr:hypothetical protein [Planctomycetota bacterium]
MSSETAARGGLAAAALGLIVAGLWHYPTPWRNTEMWGFVPHLAIAGMGLGIGLLAGEIRRASAFTPPSPRPRSFVWKDALLLAGYAALILIGVETLWARTIELTLLLAAGSLGLLLGWKSRVDVAAYLFAAALGPSMEWVCIRQWGFWQYRPEMGGVPEYGIPVWLPLVWGYLFVLFRRLAGLASGVMRFTALRGAVLLLFGGYFLISMQLVMPAIGTAYAIVLVLTVTLWRDEADLLMFLVSGTLGTLGEFISVQRDLWTYGQMAVIQELGMPVSLPFAWGFSGVLIRRFAAQWETRGPDDAARGQRHGHGEGTP